MFAARSGQGRPAVALLLEYDAPPGPGRPGGHNLVAAAGPGAALALHAVPDGTSGCVAAAGTPAEEGGGGKAVEADAGVSGGVDAAVMSRPGAYGRRRAPPTAQVPYRVGFHGRAAHPTGDPAEGVDAPAALIEPFNVVAVPGGAPAAGLARTGHRHARRHGDQHRPGVRAGAVRAARGRGGASHGPRAPVPRWSGQRSATTASGTAASCPAGSPGTWRTPGSR